MNKQHRFDTAWQAFIASIIEARTVTVSACVDYARQEVTFTDRDGKLINFAFFDELLDGHNDLFRAIHAYARERRYTLTGILTPGSGDGNDPTGEDSHLLYLEQRYLDILRGGADTVTDADPGDEHA